MELNWETNLSGNTYADYGRGFLAVVESSGRYKCSHSEFYADFRPIHLVARTDDGMFGDLDSAKRAVKKYVNNLEDA